MSWKKDRAEIKQLMAARPDPDGKQQIDNPESRAINDQLDRKLQEQPVWRRARIFYGD